MRAFADRQPLGIDIPVDTSARPERDALRRGDVAAQLAHHQQARRVDLSLDPAVL